MEKIEQYIEVTFHTSDSSLEQIVGTIEERGMPSISVSPNSGRLLTMLVALSGAKNVLEIGALGGYSGTCLARGFGPNSHLTSLELEEDYAKLAYENLARNGFGDRVTYITGPALESLTELISQGRQFDFFFIDADKGNYHHYLEYAIQLATPGAVIVIDNVLAAGTVVEEQSKVKKHYTETMKNFNQFVANHPRLESILIPLGDGLTVSRVK